MWDFDFELITLKGSDSKLLNQIQDLEKMTFAEGGEDLWTLRPMAEQQLILAALNKDIIIAYAILWKQWNNPKLAYLHSFVVNPSNRGIGLGRSFFAEIKQCLINLEIDFLQLTLEESNSSAKRIYSTEAQLVEERFVPNAYGPGEDRHHWTLDLRDCLYPS